MTSKKRIVISGLGVVSSAGDSLQENWNNLIQGNAKVKRDSRLEGLQVDFCCPVEGFPTSKHIDKSLIWRIDRFIQFALYATQQAVADAELNFATLDKRRIGIVLGNSLAGVTSLETAYHKLDLEGAESVRASLIPGFMGNMIVGQIAIQFGITGPSMLIGTACASGADAIGMAKKMLENDECDIVITGASEAPITKLIISSFAALGALSTNSNLLDASRPFDENRDGFVMSEGAGILVLEKESHAIERGAKIYATVAGYGSANDAFHVTSPQKDGAGLKDAMQQALEDAQLLPNDIESINAHGTSTVVNDQIESAAIFDIFGKKPIVTSTKGVTGHCLAASGAIEAIYSVLSIKNNTIPPVAGLKELDKNINISVAHSKMKMVGINSILSNSLGFGGQNASLIFSRYN
jgi:3-oxoacyl-[acyl-carrier-protein] synthase II